MLYIRAVALTYILHVALYIHALVIIIIMDGEFGCYYKLKCEDIYMFQNTLKVVVVVVVESGRKSLTKLGKNLQPEAGPIIHIAISILQTAEIHSAIFACHVHQHEIVCPFPCKCGPNRYDSSIVPQQ